MPERIFMHISFIYNVRYKFIFSFSISKFQFCAQREGAGKKHEKEALMFGEGGLTFLLSKDNVDHTALELAAIHIFLCVASLFVVHELDEREGLWPPVQFQGLHAC